MDNPSNSLTGQLGALQDAFQKFYYIGLTVEKLASDGSQESEALKTLPFRQLSLREAVLQQQITETVNLLNGLLGECLTQKKTDHVRNLKVNQAYYMHKLKNDPMGAGRPIPWIQLKGYWLQQAGFEIGASFKVRVMQGCLVVTVEG